MEIFTLIDLELLNEIKNHLSNKLKDDLEVLEKAEKMTFQVQNETTENETLAELNLDLQKVAFDVEESIRMEIQEGKRLIKEITKIINEKGNHIKTGSGKCTDSDNRCAN